jgi:hypothetical protein
MSRSRVQSREYAVPSLSAVEDRCDGSLGRATILVAVRRDLAIDRTGRIRLESTIRVMPGGGCRDVHRALRLPESPIVYGRIYLTGALTDGPRGVRDCRTNG